MYKSQLLDPSTTETHGEACSTWRGYNTYRAWHAAREKMPVTILSQRLTNSPPQPGLG
jgi:hypothetical protein